MFSSPKRSKGRVIWQALLSRRTQSAQTLWQNHGMNITRAISIRQPWVEYILRGIKKKEYRSVPTRIRERVYLYAALKPGGLPRHWRRIEMERGGLPAGRIVGTVEIVGCRWNSRLECYEYHLARPERLPRSRVPRNQPNPIFWRPQF